MITLKDIDTMIRWVLHELGFATVRKQVVDKEDMVYVYSATASIKINPLGPNTEDNLQTIKFVVTFCYDENEDDVEWPKAFVDYQSSRSYNGKGRFPVTRMTGHTLSPDFFFLNKDQLLEDMENWLKEAHLPLRYNW